MPQTPEVRDRALLKAQWVRSQRAELKRALKEGRVDAWALLRGDVAEWEPVAREIRLDRLLLLIPGVGEVTRDEALAELRIPGRLEPVGMSFAQRAQLSEMLRLALAGEPLPPTDELDSGGA